MYKAHKPIVGPRGQARFGRLLTALDRGPRKIEWHEAGNDLYNTGGVWRETHPFWAYTMERWLDRGHPHHHLWNAAWQRIYPYWGDPFCAAYCQVWSGLYGRYFTKEDYRLELTFEQLSAGYREWYKKDHAADGEDDTTSETNGDE